MVSNGNEGYRARGRYDPHSPVLQTYNWMNDGSKGESLPFIWPLPEGLDEKESKRFESPIFLHSAY